MTTDITMYGAEWCGDCRRSKRFLDSNNVSYKYIDVESDASASEKVIEINRSEETRLNSSHSSVSRMPSSA